MAAQSEIVEDDETGEQRTIESSLEGSPERADEIEYPVVPGVSAEKVKQIIDAHLSGDTWRDISGNSQTHKAVRDAWKSLHSDLHTSTHDL